MNREQWLNTAIDELRPLFNEQGESIPVNLRVSCGWPSRGATSSRNRTIGQCWYAAASADETIEIFISPVLSNPVRVLDVLVHELVHAIVGHEAGHKAPFKRLATAVGLEGKMTATHAGEKLEERLNAITERIGEYPHAELSPGAKLKKQGTRMIKAECNGCGMVIRTTQKWIDEIGLPECHCGGEFMQS